MDSNAGSGGMSRLPSGGPIESVKAGPHEQRGSQLTARYFAASIVLGLLCAPPLGFLFGFLAMRQAREEGSSTVLGWVGLAASVLGTALWVFLLFG